MKNGRNFSMFHILLLWWFRPPALPLSKPKNIVSKILCNQMARKKKTNQNKCEPKHKLFHFICSSMQAETTYCFLPRHVRRPTESTLCTMRTDDPSRCRALSLFRLVSETGQYVWFYGTISVVVRLSRVPFNSMQTKSSVTLAPRHKGKCKRQTRNQFDDGNGKRTNESYRQKWNFLLVQ